MYVRKRTCNLTGYGGRGGPSGASFTVVTVGFRAVGHPSGGRENLIIEIIL